MSEATPSLDAMIAALWRAIAKALAHGRRDQEAIKAGELVEEQLRLTYKLWRGERDV